MTVNRFNIKNIMINMNNQYQIVAETGATSYN
eukprot:CAMPEP_0114682404 /NCGR_PEP_ID=MMETSP0191-20121206/56488_1 /TAXON_ID=126664 /ORGANISM="Sorites sp." /LENGTH=31 /DNA_ID= /DNA_START= /DNA_END= /DNA_ORIENTATION=